MGERMARCGPLLTLGVLLSAAVVLAMDSRGEVEMLQPESDDQFIRSFSDALSVHEPQVRVAPDVGEAANLAPESDDTFMQSFRGALHVEDDVGEVDTVQTSYGGKKKKHKKKKPNKKKKCKNKKCKERAAKERAAKHRAAKQ